MKAYRLSHILLSIVLLILVVLFSRWVDVRWDVTDDKRYTLAPEAAQLVTHLEDELVITSLLEGDVPSSFRLLKSYICLLYTSPSPRDQRGSRMPSSA